MIALHAAICDSTRRFCTPTFLTLNHPSILHLIQERIKARQLGSTLRSREREGGRGTTGRPLPKTHLALKRRSAGWDLAWCRYQLSAPLCRPPTAGGVNQSDTKRAKNSGTALESHMTCVHNQLNDPDIYKSFVDLRERKLQQTE